MSRIRFLNTYVDNLSMDESIQEIDKLIKVEGYHYVVTPNVDHIVKLEDDKEFKEVYNKADLILTDGMPLVWISKIKKPKIREKISGSDLFPKVCELAAMKGYKIFLLGAADGVAKQAALNLKLKYPELNIVGTYSPSFGFEKNKIEIENIIKLVNELRPDILAVGVGAPKQEKFIYKYKNDLKVPVSLAIGASIDFEARTVSRAPIWMQKAGLEWFYRFLKEPKRMFKRYFIDDLKIIKLLFKY